MLGFRLAVTLADGREETVEPTIADEIAWERHFDRSIIGAFASGDSRLEWIYWLAWHSLHRRQVVTEDFDPFLEQVASLTAQGEGAARPTRPARRAGSQPKSP